jgi:hypothetical protein
MHLLDNWWSVVKGSYSVWLGQLIGWASAYQVWLSSLSPEDQVTLHAAGQIHWIPIAIAFLGIFGISAARAISQPSLGK